MNIIVQGIGEKNYKPDQITLNFDFKTVENSYEKALECGTKNVKIFLNLLIKLGFSKEDFKTKSFRVSEEKHYDDKNRVYVLDGYAYYQNSKLDFDYNMEKLSSLMEETSKLDNAPSYRINFTLKDGKKSQEEVLALAYENALFQANAISKASDTKIVNCEKISFKPFDSNDYYSYSTYDTAVMSKSRCCSDSTRQTISNIFIPEDISVSTEIYCKFLAE